MLLVASVALGGGDGEGFCRGRGGWASVVARGIRGVLVLILVWFGLDGSQLVHVDGGAASAFSIFLEQVCV